MNWHELVVPSNSLIEVFVRGTATYLLLFLALRFLLKRAVGAIGIPDLLVVILVAEGAQHAMGDYRSITEAALLIGTILGWSYALNWLSFHVPWLERLTSAPEVVVVRNGRMDRRAMRRELLTEDELRSLLREQGVADLAEVERAAIEGDGELSVIRRGGANDGGPRGKAKSVA